MFWLLLITVIFLRLVYDMYWKRKNLPPGPTPLPLLGNVLSIMWHFPGYEQYHKWKKEYGPIYTYWLGPFPIVTVNELDLVQKMFVQDGDTYADRKSLGEFTKKYRGGILGVVETSGRVWREQRRFTLHTLRDFGLGKERMQEQILDEADSLLTRLEKECEETGSTWPIKYTELTVASVINIMLFGYRFDQEREPEFYEVRKLLDRQNQELQNPLLVAFLNLPEWVYMNIPIISQKFKFTYEVRDKLFEFFEKNIATHREAIDFTNDECNDFCDAYLKEMYKTKDDPESTFHDKQFVNVCMDLWLAGMETTASTMSWGIALLLNYPEVLTKLHNELDRVIGSDRLVTMHDKNELHYVNAFVNEVQRWANIIPQNLLRQISKDVTVEGHTLRAGTPIAPQISVLMTDEKVFPEPFSFRPDRFIDESGKLRSFKHFLPFSIGKRQCLGEGLARMELFLFFANLVHRFNMSPIDSTKIPTLKRSMANVTKPAPFECKLERRRVQKL